MAQQTVRGNWPGNWRFPLFIAVLFVTAPFAFRLLGFERGVLASFDLAAATFLAVCSALLLKRSDDIRAQARVNDAGPFLRLVISLAVAICIFAAMTALIVDRADLTRLDKLLILASVVIVWAFANTMYTLHYAHLFYSSDVSGRDRAGLDFPDTREPLIADFAYFSFTIGVALQTADVSIRSRRIRQIATVHQIVSFFFNVGVVAVVINVLAAT